MPKVQYTITYERAVEVEVTDSELDALRKGDSNAQTAIIERANQAIPRWESGADVPPEWVMSTCTYEPEGGDLEDLFDIG